MKFQVFAQVRRWLCEGWKFTPVFTSALMVGIASPLLAEGKHQHHHHAPAEAHVHGEAELNIVIDGEQVLVAFISPLENLLGFEHAPQTAEQKKAYQDLQQQLMDYRNLFTLSNAECLQTEQHSETPFADEHEGHAEWHGEYHLQCTDFGNDASLQPQLFSNYPGVEKLSIQLISAKGQSQFIVSKDSDRISLQ